MLRFVPPAWTPAEAFPRRLVLESGFNIHKGIRLSVQTLTFACHRPQSTDEYNSAVRPIGQGYACIIAS
jgi:hypothetical protein